MAGHLLERFDVKQSLFCLLLTWLLVPKLDIHAQGAPDVPPRSSFAAEALGASVGSLAGLVTVGLITENVVGVGCGDNWGCAWGSWALAGVLGGTVGSVAGAQIGTRLSGGIPSFKGQVAGASVGIIAGAGLAYISASFLQAEKASVLLVYPVTQGLLTALGSRLLSPVRR